MKPLARYEGRYAIDENGTILNLANNTPLTPIQTNNGYFKVGLANGDGTCTQYLVHILVAKHFIPNPWDHPQVNHRDGIKAHNWKDNLEWISAAGNVEHAFRTGLRPGYMPADDKERYLDKVLGGVLVNDLAVEIGRRPETLHKMLRETAKRLGIHDRWEAIMKENRRNVAIRQLAQINSRGA